MRIPVFVSSPTKLRPSQEKARTLIVRQLRNLGLEARALGRSDYPSDSPLKEVLVIAKHCSGGVILGFEQFRADSGVWQRGTHEKRILGQSEFFSTPWNHLEAGILFALHRPLLVFREANIRGGVLDDGVTDVFVHQMPMGKISASNRDALKEVFLNWQRKVRTHYYGD